MELFKTLYKASQILNSTLTPQELLVKMLDLLISHTNAERGFIFAKNKLVASRNMEKESVEKYSSHTIVEEILKSKKPLLTIDAQLDPKFKDSESIIKGRIHSVCACPLIYQEEVYGVIYLDSTLKKGIFTSETLEFMKLLSNIGAIAFRNALKFEKLEKEYKKLKIKKQEELVGTSKEMQEVFVLIKKASSTSCPVFIWGESGTGKELVARAIHIESNRRGKEFVPLYCGGLPESLIESELFGYKKGAFTGATEDKKGLFEVAHEGTLFLDEICDIPITIQTKLLRTIQEGEVRRIGETHLRKIDVRIISATNKNPREEIKEGRFREDLYYRLNVLEIFIPPLRERKEDIPLLVDYFVKKYSKKYQKEGIYFSENAIKKLENYDWPGNVRELENVVQRAIVMQRKNPIEEEEIELKEKEKTPNYDTLSLEEIEKEVILKRVKKFKYNKKKAASSLGIPLRTLYHKLKEWKESI